MSDNKRKIRSGGTTAEVSLDKTKKYKLDSTGSLVEATTEGDNDIVFSGSKSSLRRIADLERNVSILAAKALTTDSGNNEDVGQVEYALKASKWSSARTLSLTGAVTGSVSIDGSGNVSLDTTATSDPVISLTGDVSGSGTMTNLGNVSITATIQPNSVALGTDTTGNYMVNVTGGTGISVSHTQGEGSTASVAVDTTTIATRSYADSAAAAVKTELLGGAGAAYDTLQELKSLIDAGDASLSSAISGLTIGNGTFTVSAGSGMTGGGTLGTANQTGNSSVTLSHADTSSATDLAASGRRYVTGLTFDTYGHVTGYSTATETVVDTNTITTVGAGTSDSGVSGDVKLVAGSNVSISRSGQNVTISSTDTNTTYSAGTGMSLVGTTFNCTITNTNQLTNGAGFVTSSGVTSITAGSYLTGGTITGTGTLAVDATSANTASKVVARDASGNFSAGTITATLNGQATTAIVATNLNGGYANGTTAQFSGAVSTGALTVSGGITATGEITAYYSDSRLKTNVSKIDGALEKVMAINGYTYDSSELAESLGLPKHMDQIGLLADEVEAVLPELVTKSAIEGYKTIRYDKVVSVLVNAVKEQQAQIEELQALVKKTLH